MAPATAPALDRPGRGRVIHDASTSALTQAVSGDRITLRTTAPERAEAVLAAAGAEVAANGPGALTFSGLPAERAGAGPSASLFLDIAGSR